jgi:hypothetical protein
MIKPCAYNLIFILILFLSISCKDQAIEQIPGTIDKAPVLNLNKKPVGESSNDLLSSEQYKFMQIEIQYIEGFSPTQAALNNMETFLLQRLNKPRGIQFIFTSLQSPKKSTYSVSEIDLIEKNNRTVYTKGDTIGVYFFFADAGFNEDTNNSKVLGIAYRNTSMALFQRTIHNLSGGINQPERSKLETVVLNHEFCHILGLVNIGSPLQSQHQDADPAHGRHCDNSSCLMHYTVETGNVVTNLLGGNMPQLDANCIEDLRANGGK